MPPGTQPLRDEHRELLPELELLRTAAEGIDSPAAVDLVSQALRFLTSRVLKNR
ncbi:MAG: hypothetical protein M0R74_18885 [Dehalococcoidia bacterium]|nr:hypothetical protein [Dehalococcoidia bacterium]